MAISSRHFILGMTAGLVLAFLLVSLNARGRPARRYARALAEQGIRHDHHTDLNSDKDNMPANINLEKDKSFHGHDNGDVAMKLYSQVRVLVWIMTAPENLDTKAKAVRDTWARRANMLIFFSSETDLSFPTIGLKTEEGREHLTAKTMQGFRYVYENHFNDADWFMKADDDSYVIMENLRYFLSEQNTSDPVWFGHLFRSIVKQGYYSGGGGYVLSREALKRLYEGGQNPETCRQDGGSEDAELGKCMQNLGVKTANTTDALGRSRFHCFDAETHLIGGFAPWYYNYDAMGGLSGEASISDYAISFHYVKPHMMVGLEFYIYHLRPYGWDTGRMALNANHPNKLLDDDIEPFHPPGDN